MALREFLLPWDSQPQEVVEVGQGFSAPIAFAYLPSSGLVNLANGQPPDQIGTVTTSPIQSGIAYTGGVVGYPRNISLANGATFISIWRAGTQYFGADGTRRILSNQKSGNNGFSWGRQSAVGGGATGNLTQQRLTFHGIADYTEANSTIESYVDTPVACRYNKTTGAISWFRFGVKSSADTAGSTSPGAGFQVVVGGQGDFAGASQLWIDKAPALIVFEGALSDAEIFRLTNSVPAVWNIFAPRTIWVPVSAGGSGSVSLLPSSISSSESFGTASIVRGNVNVLVSSISSTETFGNHTVSNGTLSIVPSGIASSEAFGTAILQRGTIIVTPTGIASAEAFGTGSILRGTLVIYPNGIPSGELFGLPTVTGGIPSVATSVFYVRGFSSFGFRRNS